MSGLLSEIKAAAEMAGSGRDSKAQADDGARPILSFDMLDAEDTGDEETPKQKEEAVAQPLETPEPDGANGVEESALSDGSDIEAANAKSAENTDRQMPKELDVLDDLSERLNFWQRGVRVIERRRNKKKSKKIKVQAKKMTLPGVPVVIVSSLAAGIMAGVSFLVVNGGLAPIWGEGKTEIAQVDKRLVESAHALIKEENERELLAQSNRVKPQPQKEKTAQSNPSVVKTDGQVKRKQAETPANPLEAPKKSKPETTHAVAKKTAKNKRASVKKAHARPKRTVAAAGILKVKVEDDLLLKSRGAFEEGDFARAKALLEAHLQKHPRDVDAYKYGMRLYLYGGKGGNGDLMRMAENVLALDPYDVESFLLMLKGKLVGQNADEAVALVEKYPYQVKASAQVASLAGVAYLMKGQYAQAEKMLKRAISQGVSTPDAYYDLGVALERNGKHEQALEAWKRATTLARTKPYSFDLNELERIVKGESK